MCFLVSKVVHFLAKVVIIVPYCYFATCILERSLMYKGALSQKIRGKTGFKIFFTIVELFLNNAHLPQIKPSDFGFRFVALFFCFLFVCF